MPPSPASVCSSSQEEFWRPVEFLGPISTPDVTLAEDNSLPQVFKEISSNLNGMETLFLKLLYKLHIRVLMLQMCCMHEVSDDICLRLDFMANISKVPY